MPEKRFAAKSAQTFRLPLVKCEDEYKKLSSQTSLVPTISEMSQIEKPILLFHLAMIQFYNSVVKITAGKCEVLEQGALHFQ